MPRKKKAPMTAEELLENHRLLVEGMTQPMTAALAEKIVSVEVAEDLRSGWDAFGKNQGVTSDLLRAAYGILEDVEADHVREVIAAQLLYKGPGAYYLRYIFTSDSGARKKLTGADIYRDSPEPHRHPDGVIYASGESLASRFARIALLPQDAGHVVTELVLPNLGSNLVRSKELQRSLMPLVDHDDWSWYSARQIHRIMLNVIEPFVEDGHLDEAAMKSNASAFKVAALNVRRLADWQYAIISRKVRDMETEQPPSSPHMSEALNAAEQEGRSLSDFKNILLKANEVLVDQFNLLQRPRDEGSIFSAAEIRWGGILVQQHNAIVKTVRARGFRFLEACKAMA